MEQTHSNFFKQVYYAVFKPRQYYKLTTIGSAGLVGFVCLLIAILTFFGTFLPIYNYTLGSHGFYNTLEEMTPTFRLKNGSLYAPERYEYSKNGTYILIDTDVDKFSYNDIDKTYHNVILAGRSSLIFYTDGNARELNFNMIRGLDIDNGILKQVKPFVIFILILAMIFIYLFSVAVYFIMALLYSLVGIFISSINSINMPFGIIYRTAIFSKVTIKIAYTLIGLAEPHIPGILMNLLAFAVTCVYVAFGIVSHRSDESFRYHNDINGPRDYRLDPNGYSKIDSRYSGASYDVYNQGNNQNYNNHAGNYPQSNNTSGSQEGYNGNNPDGNSDKKNGTAAK